MKIKNLKFVFIGLFIMLFNYSCNDEDIQDEYFVKYKLETYNAETGGEIGISFKSEKDKIINQHVDQNKEWEIIIGPVSKRFNAHIYITNRSPSIGTLKLHTEIQVSKNGGPFAMKAIRVLKNKYDTTIGVVSSTLEYEIDY